MSSQQTTTICTLLPIEALVEWSHNLSQLVNAPWKFFFSSDKPIRTVEASASSIDMHCCNWRPTDRRGLPLNSQTTAPPQVIFVSCKNAASKFSLAIPSGGVRHQFQAGVTILQMLWTCTERVLLLPLLSLASVAISRSSPSLSNWCTAPDTVSFPSPWITLFLSCHAFQRIIKILHLICSELWISRHYNKSLPIGPKACSFGRSQKSLIAHLIALLRVHETTVWYSSSLSVQQMSQTSSNTVVLL